MKLSVLGKELRKDDVIYRLQGPDDPHPFNCTLLEDPPGMGGRMARWRRVEVVRHDNGETMQLPLYRASEYTVDRPDELNEGSALSL